MSFLRRPRRSGTGKVNDLAPARRLRHQVEIQRVVQTRSGADIVDTWSTFATVWAEVEPLRGREFYDRQQIDADVTHTIVLRYSARLELTVKDRIRWGIRIFELESVRDIDEARQLYVCMAKETI